MRYKIDNVKEGEKRNLIHYNSKFSQKEFNRCPYLPFIQRNCENHKINKFQSEKLNILNICFKDTLNSKNKI